MIGKALLAALVAGFVAAPACATDWYVVGDPENNLSLTHVDRDSIRASEGNVAQAWAYMVLAETRENGAAAYEFRIEFDCARPRSRILHVRRFNEADQLTNDAPSNADWADVPPRSQSQAMRDFVCSAGRTEARSGSLGAAHPFARSRALLAERRGQGAK